MKGRVVVCDVVWAEVSAAFQRLAGRAHPLEEMGLHFDAITKESAETAAEVWRAYRQRGGPRERLIPDFLIGAHALTQADRLLTRDRGFQRLYFPALVIVDPATN